MHKVIDEKYINSLFETETDFTEWFGYYNYDVISRDGKKMLCNRSTFEARAITENDTIELGYYDIETKEWNYIDSTDSFNWQQGAMLQWMPGEGNDNKVIYNKSQDNHFVSVICDIETGEKKIINFPVYCVTPDGKRSISLNYERSYWCRAYHYQPVKNPQYDVNIAEDDGIFSVDLIANRVERIVDIHDIISIDAPDDFITAKHWLEHIMISPNGDKIAFLHRFTYGNGYSTRLIISSIDGKNLQVIPGWKLNDWSHFGWKGNEEFVIYSGEKKQFHSNYAKAVQKSRSRFSIMALINWGIHLPIFNGLREKLKPQVSHYKHYGISENKFVLLDKYDDALFKVDGHPSFTRDGKYLITDSYPYADGNQRLFVMNTENKKVIQIASFGAPLKGNPASCDLHPKLSYEGKYLAIDTAYTGKHRMILFQLNWEAIKSAIN